MMANVKVGNQYEHEIQTKNSYSLILWLVFIRENTIDSLSIPKNFLAVIICCCSVVFFGFIYPVSAEQNVFDDNEKKIDYTHYKTTVNGIQLHYVIGGDGQGDPIVLLHGWPQTLYEWRHIIPALMSNTYTVIAPNMRGLGESENHKQDMTQKLLQKIFIN